MDLSLHSHLSFSHHFPSQSSLHSEDSSNSSQPQLGHGHPSEPSRADTRHVTPIHAFIPAPESPVIQFQHHQVDDNVVLSQGLQLLDLNPIQQNMKKVVTNKKRTGAKTTASGPGLQTRSRKGKEKATS